MNTFKRAPKFHELKGIAIAQYLANGYTMKELCFLEDKSLATLHRNLEHVRQLLKCKTTWQLISVLTRRGLIHPSIEQDQYVPIFEQTVSKGTQSPVSNEKQTI